MKVLEVITATNTNPRYLACAPLWIEFWLTIRIEGWVVRPRLLFVGDTIPGQLKRYSKFIELAPLVDVPSAFYAQNIRLLAGRWSTSDFSMTTDVDMLPLNQKVTTAALHQAINHPKSFIVARDVLQGLDEYPICYTLAAPSTWAQIFPIDKSNSEQLQLLFKKIRAEGHYTGSHGAYGWTSDQETLYEEVNAYEISTGNETVLLTDKQTGHRRLDRWWARTPINWLALIPVALGVFTDYHMLLPAEKYSRFHKVLQLVVRFKFGPSRTLRT